MPVNGRIGFPIPENDRAWGEFAGRSFVVDVVVVSTDAAHLKSAGYDHAIGAMQRRESHLQACDKVLQRRIANLTGKIAENNLQH